MNIETLLPWGLTVAVGIVGWFVRVLWDADKEMRAGLSKLREELPERYVMRDDYRRDIYDIKQLLRDIDSKLDSSSATRCATCSTRSRC